MKKYFLFLFLSVVACKSQPETITEKFQAKVIGIKDGDSIVVLFDGKSLIIRLDHVDCPEIRNSQPFGRAAKKFTSDFCYGQKVTVLNHKKFDRYHRLVAVIINERGENLNKELVKAGLAWHFKRYSKVAEYDSLEADARRHRRGLWQDKNPIAPWDWRRGKNQIRQ